MCRCLYAHQQDLGLPQLLAQLASAPRRASRCRGPLQPVHGDQVNGLREKIGKIPDCSLVKMLHAGSVAKRTALKTLNDLDVSGHIKQADAPDSDSQLVPWLADHLSGAAPPSMSRGQFAELEDLHRQGWTIREIVAETGFHPAMTAKRLKGGASPHVWP